MVVLVSIVTQVGPEINKDNGEFEVI